MRFVFSAFLWVALIVPAMAQGGVPDANYNLVVANRDSYAKVIWLYGDSISRGFATGTFTDLMSPTDPLFQFASIANMADMALSENGVINQAIVVYAGNISAADIGAKFASGLIRSGDVVVVEDAAVPSASIATTPDQYRDWWLTIRDAATRYHDVTLVMMTMFDYCHDGNLACTTTNQFDTVQSGGKTWNDAIREAASADPDDYVGQTLLIDMNAAMDNWRSSALSLDGIDVMHGDGIHPNVWGQMKMVGLILRTCGLRYMINTVETMKALASANIATLKYGVSSFTASRATVYVPYLMLP